MDVLSRNYFYFQMVVGKLLRFSSVVVDLNGKKDAIFFLDVTRRGCYWPVSIV